MDTLDQLVELNRAYIGRLRHLLPYEVANERKISAPLLLDCLPEYQDAERKIMLVGQETFGWWDFFGEVAESSQVEVYMTRYGQFMRSRYHSTFWHFADKLRNAINPDSTRASLLWNNILKLDEDKRRLQSDLARPLLEILPILQEEVRILRPHVVVFVTGPDYDWALSRALPDVRFEPCQGFQPNQLSKVHHPTLPRYAYRTYHPNFLSFSKLTDRVIERIESEVLRDYRRRLEIETLDELLAYNND